MKNKLFQAGMFSLVLAFGVLLVGCPDPTAAIDPGDLPALTGSVYINSTGYGTITPKVGDTFTVNTYNLGGTGTMNVKWVRDNVVISGATGSTYLLTSDDVGKIISVRVSREGYGGYLSASVSNPVLPSSAPNLTGTVTITFSGTYEVGQTLTADISNLDGTGTPNYQWMRVVGNSMYYIGTDATYTLTTADTDAELRVRVVRSGYYGSAFGYIGPNGQTVLSGYINLSFPPGSNSMTPKVGFILTVNTDNLGGDTGVITYSWFWDNVVIPGATGSTYTIALTDVGKTNISVQVTRTGYYGTVRTSYLTYPVLPDTAPDLTGTVTIDGTLRVEQTLTANTSALEGTGALIYRWMRESTTYLNSYDTISGATSSTYTLTSADVGRKLMVMVIRSGYYGTVSVQTSDPVTN